MTPFDTLLQRLGIRPGDLTGAWLAGEIPVSEAFINRLLAERLRQHPHVASVVITPGGGDEATVRVEPRSRLVPAIPIAVRIEAQPVLPDEPTLVLRWSMPSAGPLAMIARRIAGHFTGLPPGVRIDRDLILVDLRGVMRAHNAEDVLPLVRRVAFHTRPGALVIEVEAGIR